MTIFLKVFPEKSSWCWNEQVRKWWCVKRFEQAQRLEIVLYKNVPFCYCLMLSYKLIQIDVGELTSSGDDPTKKPSRSKTRRWCALTTSVDEGSIYPLDLWHLLAQHIMPEDVQGFANICRGTYLIIQTANFWHSLYKRWGSFTVGVRPHLTCRSRLMYCRKCACCTDAFYLLSSYVQMWKGWQVYAEAKQTYWQVYDGVFTNIFSFGERILPDYKHS